MWTRSCRRAAEGRSPPGAAGMWVVSPAATPRPPPRPRSALRGPPGQLCSGSQAGSVALPFYEGS